MLAKRNSHMGRVNNNVLLGIETSCDDTGVALVNQDGEILSNCIHSQLKRHLWHGGIIPMVAKEYHVTNIDRVARRAFEESQIESISRDVSAISVTNRPGMECSLQVGLNYARNLAKKYSKPLIPIHHMQAHALMPLLDNKQIRFPFMALLISGGHCILALAKRFNQFHVLGESKDEAPGDLLDKFARRLKLKNLGPPYDSLSGGASVELLANRPNANRFRYFNVESAIPMRSVNDCDFSFSGYRGSYDPLIPMFDDLWMSGDKERLLSELADACASLQRIMLVQMARKLRKALAYYRNHWRYANEDAFSEYNLKKPKHLGFSLLKLDQEESNAIDIVVSGGVAANSYFTEGLRNFCRDAIDSNMKVYTPHKSHCSDNGLMVAWNGLLHYREHLEHKHARDSQSSNVFEDDKMDSIVASARCPMGQNLGDDVKATSCKLPNLKLPELRLG